MIRESYHVTHGSLGNGKLGRCMSHGLQFLKFPSAAHKFIFLKEILRCIIMIFVIQNSIQR